MILKHKEEKKNVFTALDKNNNKKKIYFLAFSQNSNVTFSKLMPKKCDWSNLLFIASWPAYL